MADSLGKYCWASSLRPKVLDAFSIIIPLLIKLLQRYEKYFIFPKKYLAKISNKLQKLVKAIFYFVPLYRQKETKAVRRLEWNGDIENLINNILSTF